MLRSVAVPSETREYCDPVGYVNGGKLRKPLLFTLAISVPIYSYHEYVERPTLRDYMLRNFQYSSLKHTSTTSSHSIEKMRPYLTENYVFAENVDNGMDLLMSHNVVTLQSIA